jgi:hypothetical protein
MQVVVDGKLATFPLGQSGKFVRILDEEGKGRTLLASWGNLAYQKRDQIVLASCHPPLSLQNKSFDPDFRSWRQRLDEFENEVVGQFLPRPKRD